MRLLSLIALTLIHLAVPTASANSQGDCAQRSAYCFHSLTELSVDTLRERQYEASYRFIEDTTLSEYSGAMLSFEYDDIRQYARLLLPNTRRPQRGFPAVVFAHGWVGIDGAPTFEFAESGLYGRMMTTYLDAGYAVLIPGFRGHGTVQGVPAQGIEFLRYFDNSSYLSPTFYAQDLVTSIQAIPSLSRIEALNSNVDQLLVDISEIHLVAHSQGGDVALTALAIMNENRLIDINVDATSIWSGCIADRFSQLESYGPLADSLDAFMSGDGSWTGSAIGKNGAVNPNFVFAWPADWIGTLDPNSADWTWQSDTWNKSYRESISAKYATMYATLNHHFSELDGASYDIAEDSDGKVTASHDPRVRTALMAIGGFDQAHRLKQPLIFNISDRDYYSIPHWNLDLRDRINAQGGQASVFIYRGTTHSLGVSQHEWFSPKNTQDAVPLALENDLQLFSR